MTEKTAKNFFTVYNIGLPGPDIVLFMRWTQMKFIYIAGPFIFWVKQTSNARNMINVFFSHRSF